MMYDVVVIPRFQVEVEKHLKLNYIERSRPLIMGIFGRSGDGKTAQLASVLNSCGVEEYRLNAADLESGLAGEPGKLIARTYSEASSAIAKDIPSAMVIDDIDTTLGEWKDNTGTVNHQQVLAELMHLADRPIDTKRSMPRRVPIFVTGNDLSKLYLPLRRHGRMAHFFWRPRPEEAEEVVVRLFAEFADEDAAREVSRIFAKEVLAFFGDIRRTVIERQVASQLAHVRSNMKYLLVNRDSFPIQIMFEEKIGKDELLEVGLQLQSVQTDALTDYTREEAM